MKNTNQGINTGEGVRKGAAGGATFRGIAQNRQRGKKNHPHIATNSCWGTESMPDGNGTARRRALGRKIPQRSKGNGRLEEENRSSRRRARPGSERIINQPEKKSINPKIQKNGDTKA
jgi:hypothetical protein